MAKRKVEEEDEDLVMVGEGADDTDTEEDDRDEAQESDEGEDDGEEKPAVKKKAKKTETDEDDGDSDEEDERVGHGEDDEADSETGKEKRESRKERRERQRRARQRNELELGFLRSRNESLERKINEIEERQNRTEVSSIDSRIGQIQSQLRVADQVLARAHEQGTGEDVVEAQNIRDKLRDNLSRLNSVKTDMSSRSRNEDPPVDSRLVFHAQTWMSKNEWYDPQGRDPDSRIVAAIDSRLAQEGFNPSTPEYWDELDSRTRRRLPHLFKSDRRVSREADDEDDDDQDTRRQSGKERRASGPRFSAGGRERPLRKNEVYVSPERKQALMEAGAWDDPVLRKKYLKRYAEYDRDNRGQRR